MVKKGKKGWLRIVEAVISALIVLSAALIVLINNDGEESLGDCERVDSLLQEIAHNNTLRNEILMNNTLGVRSFLDSKITDPLYSYGIRLCELNSNKYCPVNAENSEGSDVCAGERIIAGNSNPVKIKLFIIKLKS